MYYTPEPVAKPHDLATELHQRGHQVTVVTGFPNYPSGRIYDQYRMRFWQWEEIDSIHVLRVPFLIDRSLSAIRRIMAFLSFTIVASVLSLFLVKRPDVIWSYQVGMPGVLVGALKRVPLIHEVQDLWPEWGKTSQLGLEGGLYWLLDQQERFIYRHARAILTISNGFKRVLMSKGVPETKVTVVPNWANEQNFRFVPRDSVLGEQEGLNGFFNVMYVGNIGTAQGISVVLEAARLLADLPKLRIVLYGDGVEREQLLAQIHEQQLDNVRMPGSRSQGEIARYIAFSDALLIPLRDEPTYAITIPSKTYGYLASGRPIIVSARGDVADLITSLQAGLVCPPEDSRALADAIRQLYLMPSTKQKQLGDNGRKAFTTQFTRQILVDQYVSVFKMNTKK